MNLGGGDTAGVQEPGECALGIGQTRPAALSPQAGTRWTEDITRHELAARALSA